MLSKFYISGKFQRKFFISAFPNFCQPTVSWQSTVLCCQLHCPVWVLARLSAGSVVPMRTDWGPSVRCPARCSRACWLIGGESCGFVVWWWWMCVASACTSVRSALSSRVLVTRITCISTSSSAWPWGWPLPKTVSNMSSMSAVKCWVLWAFRALDRYHYERMYRS